MTTAFYWLAFTHTPILHKIQCSGLLRCGHSLSSDSFIVSSYDSQTNAPKYSTIVAHPSYIVLLFQVSTYHLIPNKPRKSSQTQSQHQHAIGKPCEQFSWFHSSIHYILSYYKIHFALYTQKQRDPSKHKLGEVREKSQTYFTTKAKIASAIYCQSDFCI